MQVVHGFNVSVCEPGSFIAFIITLIIQCTYESLARSFEPGSVWLALSVHMIGHMESPEWSKDS